MKKMMLFIVIIFAILTVLLGYLSGKTENASLFSLAITAGTILYHFAMRLIIGGIFQIFMHNRADYRNKWYQVRAWEMAFYHKIHVKKWKNHMPTFEESLFDPGIHTWDEIAQAMCQAELVHETIALFSFLPVFAGIWFGSTGVFVITSVIACVIDLSFVVIQRYNRPRVIRLAERKGMTK